MLKAITFDIYTTVFDTAGSLALVLAAFFQRRKIRFRWCHDLRDESPYQPPFARCELSAEASDDDPSPDKLIDMNWRTYEWLPAYIKCPSDR
jgi:FMN phosphatase YigB (HAD superfamily)